MVNLSYFCKGDAWGRFRGGSNLADRLCLRRGRESRHLWVGSRSRVPDTFHVYRTGIPTVSSPDDRRIVTESWVRG